jgi:hypothetical protein
MISECCAAGRMVFAVGELFLAQLMNAMAVSATVAATRHSDDFLIRPILSWKGSGDDADAAYNYSMKNL